MSLAQVVGGAPTSMAVLNDRVQPSFIAGVERMVYIWRISQGGLCEYTHLSLSDTRCVCIRRIAQEVVCVYRHPFPPDKSALCIYGVIWARRICKSIVQIWRISQGSGV